jgi:hypothetical protein
MKARITFKGRIPRHIKDEYLQKEFVVSESIYQSIVKEGTEEEIEDLIEKMNSVSDCICKVVGIEDLSFELSALKMISEDVFLFGKYSFMKNEINPGIEISKQKAFEALSCSSHKEKDEERFEKYLSAPQKEGDYFRFFIQADFLFLNLKS